MIISDTKHVTQPTLTNMQFANQTLRSRVFPRRILTQVWIQRQNAPLIFY